MSKAWVTKTLAEACEIKPSKSEARGKLTDADVVSFLPMDDLGIDRKPAKPTQTRILREVIGSYTYFAEGDVLLAKITPCFENGKLGIASALSNGIGFGSSEYFVFRPDRSVTKEWLYYFLSRRAFREEGAARMTGAVGHKRVAKEFIEKYPIPVPPLLEQQRIVGILDEAFAGLATAKAHAEKNLQNAHALLESYLESILAESSHRWSEVALGDEIELLAGFAFKSARFTSASADVRLLRGDNIVQGALRWDDVKRWPASDVSAYREYELHAGDVVLAMDRPWVKAGMKRAILSDEDLPCLLVQRTARLRGKSNLENRFLHYLIGGSAFARHILGVQTGIGVPHISGQQIKDFAFRRPTVAEQRLISAKLDILKTETERLEYLYSQKLVALESLKESLLHWAFTGAF